MAGSRDDGLRMRRTEETALDEDDASDMLQPPSQVVELAIQRIGIYGWRKYCLYLSVMLLTCLALINLGLIIWILQVAEIKDDHAGPVFFKEHSVQIRGRAEFTSGIVAQRFAGFDQSDLVLESNKNIRLVSSSKSNPEDVSIISLQNGNVEVTSRSFQAGFDDVYLEANSSQVTVKSNEIFITSDSGLVVDGEIQTSRITNLVASSQGLQLESIGQDLRLKAAQNVVLESSTSDVNIQALGDVRLQGSTIQIETTNLVLNSVPVPPEDVAASTHQLCLCSNGLVYRVDAAKFCSTGADDFC